MTDITSTSGHLNCEFVGLLFLSDSSGDLENEPTLFYFRLWRWRNKLLETRDVMPDKRVKHDVTRHLWLCWRTERLFVTFVTEVSLISRDLNLRFERFSISRRLLWSGLFSSVFDTPAHPTRVEITRWNQSQKPVLTRGLSEFLYWY